MTYWTSHYALKDRADLKEGESLLVLGAAGGVGLAAVEIGKAMGAKVIAAASSEEKFYMFVFFPWKAVQKQNLKLRKIPIFAGFL